MNKKYAYLFLGIVVLWIIIFPVRLVTPFIWHDYQLVQHGKKTQGLVTSFEPNNHSALHYSYSVGGMGYQSFGAGENLPNGTSITIYYLPENPQISRFGLPSNNFWNDTIPFVLAMLAMSVVIPFQFYKMLNAPPKPPQTSLLHKTLSFFRKSQ
jgi:hypothetical protein